MKWITTDYKGDKKVWYSEEVINKIKPALELYANSWIDSERYNGLTYNAKPAQAALEYLRYIDGE